MGRRRGDTHPPRKQPTGRGGWVPGARLGRKTAWGFRNAAAVAAPGLGLPPSSVLVRLTTSLLATRPGSARFRGRRRRRRRNRLQRLETPAAGLPSVRERRACAVRRRGRDGRGRRDIHETDRGDCSSGWMGRGLTDVKLPRGASDLSEMDCFLYRASLFA